MEGGIPLEEWTGLSETLDWRLGKLAYQLRGTRAFLANEVPHIAHQGGLVPYRAAEVLLASCEEAEANGTLEPEIRCLELGMGLGLFAAQVLDRFQERCRAAGKDWYDRLTWYATDGTPAVLQDVQRTGIFERHPGRVALGQANALQPGSVRRLDGITEPLTGQLRAIFHSYVFCMLPMNLYRVGPRAAAVIAARTVLRHPEHLPRFTALTTDQILGIVARGSPDEHLALVPLHPLLDLELALSPVDPRSPSLGTVHQIYAWMQQDLGGAEERWVLHSVGAEASLQGTLQALRPDGFLLYRDYGPTSASEADQQLIHQHYGSTIAVHVNHYALERLLGTPAPDGRPWARVTAPAGEGERLIRSRLVSRADIPRTRDAFAQGYDGFEAAALQREVQAARAAPPAESAALYDAALAREPGNWALLTEAAEARYRRSGDAAGARALIARSLAINPWTQAEGWTLEAEIALDAGDLAAAAAALERAAACNAEHWRIPALRARLHGARGELEAAAIAAATALALDRSGERQPALRAALDAAAAALAERRDLERRLREARVAGG